MLGLGRVCRLWRASVSQADPAPEEVVTYEGHIHLNPTDDYGDGSVMLVGKGDLVSFLYEQLDVPSEDGSPMETSFYGRIMVEVLPNPDLTWWP